MENQTEENMKMKQIIPNIVGQDSLCNDGLWGTSNILGRDIGNFPAPVFFCLLLALGFLQDYVQQRVIGLVSHMSRELTGGGELYISFMHSTFSRHPNPKMALYYGRTKVRHVGSS